MLFGEAARQFEQPVHERFPDIEIVVVSQRDLAGVDVSGVNCAAGWNFPADVFAGLPALRWIQSISVGVDNWIGDPSIPTDVVITNTKGLYADEIAEYITWAMLTLSRRLHVAMHNQQKRRWRQVAGHSLAGKTIGIAGMGHLGRATARYARSLGMRVAGICRTADDPRAADLADKVVATADIHDVLGELDFLVICLPLTEQTEHLFGAAEIARLKPGAIIVNVARQSITDYKSILEAVRQGHLAGAALDVFDKEPLRKRSPLWKNENVLITPHVGAFTKEYKAKVSELLCANLQRFCAGDALQGVVDRGKGY